MSDDLTIREMMKLAKLNVQKLADEFGLEYGLVSTAVSMDEKGEVPKRQSVRDRIAQIREHLTLINGFSEGKATTADWWSDTVKVAKRWPPPCGCSAVYDWNGRQAGFHVRLAIDPDGESKLYRFVRVVNGPVVSWIDVVGGESGGVRSVTLDEFQTGKRVFG